MIDVVVVIGFVFVVVYLVVGNIGGGGFVVIYLVNGENVVLDFREKVFLKVIKNMFLDK